jgi:hypothetical protein
MMPQSGLHYHQTLALKGGNSAMTPRQIISELYQRLSERMPLTIFGKHLTKLPLLCVNTFPKQSLYECQTDRLDRLLAKLAKVTFFCSNGLKQPGGQFPIYV